MAGACYGIEAVPARWQAVCEGVDDAVQYAMDMYQLQQSVTSSHSSERSKDSEGVTDENN